MEIRCIQMLLCSDQQDTNIGETEVTIPNREIETTNRRLILLDTQKVPGCRRCEGR